MSGFGMHEPGVLGANLRRPVGGIGGRCGEVGAAATGASSETLAPNPLEMALELIVRREQDVGRV